MSQRDDYRASLVIRLRDAANNLGDTMFNDTALNDFLASAPRRLFPNLYKLQEFTAVAQPNSDGLLLMTSLTPTTIKARQVTRVWDDDGNEVHGWRPRGDTYLAGFEKATQAAITIGGIEYMTPHAVPADDSTDAGIPDEWYDGIVLAAGVIALEAWGAEKVDLKNYQPSGESGVDENEVLNLLDMWQRALAREVESKGYTLPPMGL